MNETTELFSLIQLTNSTVVEESWSSLFSLFSDWLPYKTVKE